MENLKSIKNRIKTINSIIKATNAMKMVSNVKLAKISNKNKAAAPSFNTLKMIFQKAAKEALFDKSLPNDFWLKKKEGASLVIVFSTNQGFCGSFSQNIAELSKKMISDNHGAFIEVFGKKGAAIKANSAYGKNEISIGDDNFKDVSLRLSQLVFDYIKDHGVFNIFLISGEFRNVLVQRAAITNIYPIEEDSSNEYTEIEGGTRRCVDELFRFYLEKLFFAKIVEHKVSELSARVMAMDHSVKNAKDMFEKLGVLYNTIRQAKITQELTEIVSSMESVH